MRQTTAMLAVEYKSTRRIAMDRRSIARVAAGTRWSAQTSTSMSISGRATTGRCQAIWRMERRPLIRAIGWAVHLLRESAPVCADGSGWIIGYARCELPEHGLQHRIGIRAEQHCDKLDVLYVFYFSPLCLLLIAKLLRQVVIGLVPFTAPMGVHPIAPVRSK